MASLVLRDTFEATKVSVQVTSQLSAMVTLSGRLLSDLHRPVGSRVEGIWTDANDLLLMSLNAAWRDLQPALLVQNNSGENTPVSQPAEFHLWFQVCPEVRGKWKAVCSLLDMQHEQCKGNCRATLVMLMRPYSVFFASGVLMKEQYGRYC